MATSPVLAVLLYTPDFGNIWPRLAYSVGAEPLLCSSLSEVEGAGSPCGVLVAAAGAERDALPAVTALRQRGLAEVAVVGAETDHRLAVELVRAGAESYFALPDDLSALRAWMAERVARARLPGRGTLAVRAPREQYDFGWLLGWSPPLRAALERAAKVIPRASATVLITGETGTGKDLLARAIHDNGPRRAKPFVAINCNALPATLLEAELFGYERGAFTDARSAKPGLFEAADGGTLFLDEVGDLSPELQGKLLRVLENRQVRRLGSLRTVAVDVRIIAATHVDLAQRARERRFRTDLYYRLNVVPIHIPPLRERGDDILFLAEHFVERLSEEYGLPPPSLSPAVRRALLGHAWPGNVRELRNAIERALVLGDGELREEDLLGEEGASAQPPPTPIPFPASMATIERAVARATLEHCDGNKSRAAEVLKISRKRLYVLLSGHGARGEDASSPPDPSY